MSSPHDEELQRDAGAPSREPVEKPRWTRRFAPVLLLAGGALAASTFLGDVPKEREIELRIEDAPTIVKLDVTWTELRPNGRITEAAPLNGSSFRFAEGAAPRVVRTTVRLPDGAYDLEIAVDRTVGQETTHRTVTLGDADRITIPVR